MAEVYRAVMTGPEGFERELVLKRILPRLSETGDFKTMFIREAKISALLLHPNIVQIYEFGEADGAYFIAMESVQGVTLRELLTTLRKEQRAMPHMVAADVTRQICVGLDYAHTLHGPDGEALEIVHQDISPTNIMLAYNGTVKILDFGIARAASFAEEEAKKGLIKGKVSYLSPEQIHVRPFDARADVFALGVVFHEMLTGRRLFQASNDITRMRELLAAPIPPPSAMNATVPRELDRIVMKALELDPQGSLPVGRRHGRGSRAHADRGALLEPRPVEAAARALQAGRRPAGRRRRDDDKANLEQHHRDHVDRRRLPPAVDAHRCAVRHNEETQIRWTARCAPSGRACSGRAGARADQGDAASRWSLAGAAGRGGVRWPKPYMPDLVMRATSAAAAEPVTKNQEADAPAAEHAPAAPPAKAAGQEAGRARQEEGPRGGGGRRRGRAALRATRRCRPRRSDVPDAARYLRRPRATCILASPASASASSAGPCRAPRAARAT